MAYIQKVKRKQDTAYRVFILVDKEKRITKTFSTKRSAVQFVNSVESDRNKLLAYTQSKSRTLLSLVIDKYLNNEYKGTRVNDERIKLDFWIKALDYKPIIDITTTDINEALSTLSAQLKMPQLTVMLLLFQLYFLMLLESM